VPTNESLNPLELIVIDEPHILAGPASRAEALDLMPINQAV
jgi:hypothetical protein